MTSAPAHPPSRIAPNLDHAFDGVWRLTWRRYLLPSRWISVVVGLAVLALLCLGSGGRFDQPANYTEFVIRLYVTFLVPATAFMAAAGAMRDEMKSATVDYVLTRPLPRPAFVLFKFAAQGACVQLDLLLAFAVVLGVGWIRGAAGLTAAVPQLLLAQVLLGVAFTAFGFLCGVITGRFVVIGLFYGGLVEAGVGQIPTQLNRLSMTHQVRELLLPLAERTASTASAASLGAWFLATAIVLTFTAIMLGAAAAIFTLRELSGRAEP